MSTTQNNKLDVLKYPDTRTGVKLKQKLLSDQSVKNVRELRKVTALNLEEKSIVHAAYELFNSIDFSNETSQAKSLYSVFNVLDNILNYPYSEELRIINLKSFKSGIFKNECTVKFLRTVGFEPSISNEVLVFSFDKNFKRVMMAREALVSKLAEKLEGTQLADVESKLTFPSYYKTNEIMGKNLTSKTAKLERKELSLTLEEVQKLKEEAEVSSLEEYLIEFGENSREFSLLIQDIMKNSKKSIEFLLLLKELWIEVNVLHKTAVFLKQSFADPICRALITDAKDKNSKLARSILTIDINEALGICKATKDKINSIEELVQLFVQRKTYLIQGFHEQVEKLDANLISVIKSKETVERLWIIVEDIIIERLTRMPRRRRPSLAEAKHFEWASAMDPEMTIDDLPYYSKKRIADYDQLKMLMEKREFSKKRQFGEGGTYNDKQGLSSNIISEEQIMSYEEEMELDAKLQQAIWSPSTWLHSNQLIDDFIIYTVMKDVCLSAKVEMIFSLRQCFRNFILEQSAVIQTNSNDQQIKQQQQQQKKSKSKTREGGNASRAMEGNKIQLMAQELSSKQYITEQDLSALPKGFLFSLAKKDNQNGSEGTSEQNDQPNFGQEAWRHLYKNSSSYIIHATILNNRFDYMKEYLERGGDVNYKDFQQWGPLHYAAYVGNTKMISYILSRININLQDKNDEQKTAAQIAIEAGNVFGDESACSLLLERGVEVELEMWHKLLILAVNQDLVIYLKLALQRGININNPLEKTKISIHKAVACTALKILQFYSESFNQQQLNEIINQRDYLGFTAFELAIKNENKDIAEMIKKMLDGVKIKNSDIPSLSTNENYLTERARIQQQSQGSMPQAKNNSQQQIEEAKKHQKDENWKKRDFEEDEDYVKKTMNEFRMQLEEAHFKEIHEAKNKLLEKEGEVQDLKEELKKQNEKMEQLQKAIANLLQEQKELKENESKQMKKEFKELHQNFSNKMEILQQNLQNTTTNLQQMQQEHAKTYSSLKKIQSRQRQEGVGRNEDREQQEPQNSGTCNIF